MLPFWRRDPVPFVSATRPLAEHGYEEWHAVLTSGNIRALAVFASDAINAVANSAIELSIDATFGTNNAPIFCVCRD